MINVKREITVNLRRLFPKAIIYTEQPESGFKEPAFFVAKINTNSSPLLFERENRVYSYQIIYFPSKDKLNADIDNVESELLDNFKTLDGFAHLKEREFTVQDKCLIFTFNIHIYTTVNRDAIKMNGLEQKGANYGK